MMPTSKKSTRQAALMLTLGFAATALSGPGETDWPIFRGPGARGIAAGKPVATEWNAETGRNIKWKTPIPGLGHSCPIIWGDRVFVTTAISGKKNPLLRVGLYGAVVSVQDDTKHSWRVYCLDKHTGRIIWERVAHEGVPAVKRHPKASHANSTPATDGKHLVVFLGSEGLYCYDMDGKLLWKKHLGVLDSGWYVAPEAQWGFGSSPIIHDGRIILQCDVQKNSFIAAYDIKDGRQIWRTARDEVPTWSTPTLHESAGRKQIIANGYKHIGGYDFETGKEIWKLDGTPQGGGDIPVPTPIVAHDLIFITNAHGRARPVYAIRPDANGDISPPAENVGTRYIAWWNKRGGIYMQTPIVYGDLLYCCRGNGVLSCYDARTGEIVYQQRLAAGRTGFTASAVAADGKIFFTSEEGDVHVVKAGRKFELLATNPLNEICMATPAISDGVIFFRTKDHLVAVAQSTAGSKADRD